MDPTFSILTVLWSMCAAACFMFALVHLTLWLRGQRKPKYLLTIVMATAAGCNVILEMLLLLETDINQYAALLKLGNIVVFFVIVSLLWFIRIYLEAKSNWLLGAIFALWVVALIANAVSPGSVVFSQITEINQLETYWGESFSQAVGTVHPWKLTADIASILVLVFLIQATWQAWCRDRRRRAIVVGGSSVLFILLAGIHTPLVDAGIVRTPYMIGFAFLAIIAALTYQLLSEWLQTQSELLQTRQEMERLTRAVVLGEVAAGLAHELNQPLSAILSNAQAARRFLAQKDIDLNEIREIIDDIIADDKRAGEVIHGLRDMLRQPTAETHSVDVNTAIKFVANLLSGELSEQEVTIKLELSATLMPARGDKVQIQQVILNLVWNAARALNTSSQSSRHIWLRSTMDQDMARISVRDDGPGIEDKLQGILFEPFVSSHSDGLGMGLAICHRIVTRNGGRMWVEQTDSNGAEICFTLPFANGKQSV